MGNVELCIWFSWGSLMFAGSCYAGKFALHLHLKSPTNESAAGEMPT